MTDWTTKYVLIYPTHFVWLPLMFPYVHNICWFFINIDIHLHAAVLLYFDHSAFKTRIFLELLYSLLPPFLSIWSDLHYKTFCQCFRLFIIHKGSFFRFDQFQMIPTSNRISKVENTNWKGTLWKINSRRCKYYQRKIKVFLSKTIDTSKPIILSRQGWVHILLRQVDNNSQSLLFFCATTTINILKMPAFVLLPLTSITIRCSSTSCMCSIMNEFTSTFWLYVRRLALDWPLSRNISTTRTLICENYWITVLQNERFSVIWKKFVKTVCRLMYY